MAKKELPKEVAALVVALQNTGKKLLADREITKGLKQSQHASIITKWVATAQPSERELFLALNNTPGALNTSQFRQYFEKAGVLEVSSKEDLEDEYIG